MIVSFENWSQPVSESEAHMQIRIEVFTTDYLITGNLSSPDERLSDVLNFKTEASLVLTDVEVARLLAMGKTPPDHFVDARIEKHLILFASPIEQDLTQKSIYRRATREPHAVTVLLRAFEVEGTIHLTERLEIRHVLVGRQDDFIALTRATATYALHPGVTFSRDIIVFNKNQASFIGKRVPAGVPASP
jgi:hypothetical protein